MKRLVVLLLATLAVLLASGGCIRVGDVSGPTEEASAPLQVEFAREVGGACIASDVLGPGESFRLMIEPGSKAGQKFWLEIRREDGTVVPLRAWGKEQAFVLPKETVRLPVDQRLPQGSYRVICYVNGERAAEIPFRVAAQTPPAGVQMGGKAEVRDKWFKYIVFGRIPAGSPQWTAPRPETVFKAGDRIALVVCPKQPVRVDWEFRRTDGGRVSFALAGPPEGELSPGEQHFSWNVDMTVGAGKYEFRMAVGGEPVAIVQFEVK